MSALRFSDAILLKPATLAGGADPMPKSSTKKPAKPA
jgi:hypothetical protein